MKSSPFSYQQFRLFRHSIYLLEGKIARLKADIVFYRKMLRRKKLPYDPGSEKKKRKFFETQTEYNKKCIKEYKSAIKKLESKKEV